MSKQGIVFDYDLKANEELDGSEKCIICKQKLICRWTDYSGEGVCLNCGCSYQLKWGNEKQKEEGCYPYCNIKTEWIPILQEYWNETHRFCFHGFSFSESTGRKEFGDWVKNNHPELTEKDNETI